jgi:hypothetical protein
MSIHSNSSSQRSKSTITDPQDLLAFLLRSEPRLRRRDAENEVIKRFEWWNPWKPEWRPPEFSPSKKDSKREGDEARLAAYQARREENFRQRQQREQRQREDEVRAGHQSRNSSDRRDGGGDNLFEEGDKVLNEWSSKAARSNFDDFLIRDHHTADDMVRILFAALHQMKEERDAAISVISTLVAERGRTKGHMSAQRSPEGQSELLYRSVGLHYECPDFVVKAVQTAYRKSLHPDLHPSAERAEAERRFKNVEQVFDEIRRLRRL